jgi:uncharacterized repeat protein (TIGR04138 family)
MPTMQNQALIEIAHKDNRYAYEAYEFLFDALAHTQEKLGRPVPENYQSAAGPEHHVTGPELVEGYINLARKQFGRMSRVVLQFWGINTTDDIGELVFNLIEAGLLGKADSDRRSDFHALFDLQQELVESYRICWDD